MRTFVASLASLALLASACSGASVTGVGMTSPPLPSATAGPKQTSAAVPTSGPTLRPSGPPDATPTTGAQPAATPARTRDAAPPTPEASPSPAREVAAVHLRGPFGSLEGRSTPPGSDPPSSDLRILDQYAQGARLGIGLRDDLEFQRWTVSASPADSGSADEAVLLSEGPGPADRTDHISIIGPDTGEWLLRLDAEVSDSAPASYHWRLVVPLRNMPADGVLEVPAPDLLLEAGQRNTVAEFGSGCYVFTCGDSGGPTPAQDLPRIRAEGGSVVMTLSDESSFVGWRVTGWPVAGDPSDERSFGRGKVPDGTDVQVVTLPPGDWYTKIQITFDLERGSLAYYARITTD